MFLDIILIIFKTIFLINMSFLMSFELSKLSFITNLTFSDHNYDHVHDHNYNYNHDQWFQAL